MHKFSVGQAVNLIPRMLHSAADGEYEIRRLMPALDTDPETPRYRIKSVAEKHERVASESDLIRKLEDPSDAVHAASRW